MEISPVVLDRLRSAAIPSEFLKVVPGFVLRRNMLSSVAVEGVSTYAETEEPSTERPVRRVPVEPWPEELGDTELEIPGEPKWKGLSWIEPEASLEPPKGGCPREGAGPFYLTEVTLDVTGVAHMTPGLFQLACASLGAIVINTFFAMRTGGDPCPECRLVILIEDDIATRSSFRLTNDSVASLRLVVPQDQFDKVREFYQGNVKDKREGFKVKTKQRFEEILEKSGIKDPDHVRKILQHFATKDAVAGARDWALDRAEKLGGCFIIWEIPGTSSIVEIQSSRMFDGKQVDKETYKSQAKPRFSEMLPDLKDGKGRITELVVFHHGEKVSEEKVLQSLKQVLVDILKISVCRVVYWACDAAVKVDVGPGKAASLLMEGFRDLAAAGVPCPCELPVEFIYPTEGRCSINKPFDEAKMFTGDGNVRRVSFGGTHEDPIRIPEGDGYETTEGAVLDVPVDPDPTLH